MNWSIDIPVRDPDDLVLDTISAAREQGMSEDQRAVVEVLANDALERGVGRVGELLDELRGLSQAECRQRLDWARERAGLLRATEIDKRRADRVFEAAFERHSIPGPEPWSELQMCHAPDCTVRPLKENGSLALVTVERWFCPEHKDLAQPGDSEEREPPYIGVNRNGKPIPSAKEAARIAAEVRKRDEPLERERRRREELRAREAEAIEEARERYREEGEISILGIRTRPDGRIIG